MECLHFRTDQISFDSFLIEMKKLFLVPHSTFCLVMLKLTNCCWYFLKLRRKSEELCNQIFQVIVEILQWELGITVKPRLETSTKLSSKKSLNLLFTLWVFSSSKWSNVKIIMPSNKILHFLQQARAVKFEVQLKAQL